MGGICGYEHGVNEVVVAVVEGLEGRCEEWVSSNGGMEVGGS